MDTETQDDFNPRHTVKGVLQIVGFLVSFFFGPAILWYILRRPEDTRLPIAIAFFPFFVIGYFGAMALFVWLGKLRRRRGWSLPFEKRWHVGATADSDAILFHMVISAAACLFVGCVVRNIIPAGFSLIIFSMMFMFPIRDARGSYGTFPVLVTVVGFLLMLLPVRLVRLYGPTPLVIAAAFAVFVMGATFLWSTLVRKSEDAWLRERKEGVAAQIDSHVDGEPPDDN